MGIVRFALKFPHTFYVVAALILFLGVTAAVEMPTYIFPEIDIPVVSVIWQFTGLNTTEMEQRFTTYSQYSISSNVSGIKDIEAETGRILLQQTALRAAEAGVIVLPHLILQRAIRRCRQRKAGVDPVRYHMRRKPGLLSGGG